MVNLRRIAFGVVLSLVMTAGAWASNFRAADLVFMHAAARTAGNGGAFFKTDVYITNLTDQHYMGALPSGLRFMGSPRQYGVRLMKVF